MAILEIPDLDASTHVSTEMFRFSKHLVDPGFGRFTSWELRAKFLNNFDKWIDLYEKEKKIVRKTVLELWSVQVC